jgi:hypothetical protein
LQSIEDKGLMEMTEPREIDSLNSTLVRVIEKLCLFHSVLHPSVSYPNTMEIDPLKQQYSNRHRGRKP